MLSVHVYFQLSLKVSILEQGLRSLSVPSLSMTIKKILLYCQQQFPVHSSLDFLSIGQSNQCCKTKLFYASEDLIKLNDNVQFLSICIHLTLLTLWIRENLK